MTPRQRDRSLQACTKGHAEYVCKIWYYKRMLRFPVESGPVSDADTGTGPPQRFRLQLPSAPGPAGLLILRPEAPSSLIYPPRDFLAWPRHITPARQLWISEKFICMQNQKNRLTATKPKNQFALVFSQRQLGIYRRPTNIRYLYLTHLRPSVLQMKLQGRPINYISLATYPILLIGKII